jgi:hypothetical protein
MLWWVGLYVWLGVAGLTVLTLLAVRLYRQVRTLGREVSAAAARIGALTDDLQRDTPRR